MSFPQRIFVFVLFSSGNLFAQENSNWKELVIKVPVLNEQTISRINKQVSCLEGLRFTGYVRSASCLLIKYDPEKIIDTLIITKTVHFLNHKIQVKTIKEFSFYDVIDGKVK